MKLADVKVNAKVYWKKNSVDVYTVEAIKNGEAIITNVHGHRVYAKPRDLWLYTEAK